MIVARHSQVERAPDIDAKLKRVTAPSLQQVSYKLVLLFLLVERAVTTAGELIQAGAESESPSVLIPIANKTFKQARRESSVKIQPGNTCIRRRLGAEIVGYHTDSVLEE